MSKIHAGAHHALTMGPQCPPMLTISGHDAGRVLGCFHAGWIKRVAPRPPACVTGHSRGLSGRFYGFPAVVVLVLVAGTGARRPVQRGSE